MEKEVLNNILAKIGAEEDDIQSIGETWAMDEVTINNIKTVVRGKYKYYDLTLKDGRKFFFRRDPYITIIEQIEKLVNDLMF